MEFGSNVSPSMSNSHVHVQLSCPWAKSSSFLPCPLEGFVPATLEQVHCSRDWFQPIIKCQSEGHKAKEPAGHSSSHVQRQKLQDKSVNITMSIHFSCSESFESPRMASITHPQSNQSLSCDSRKDDGRATTAFSVAFGWETW